MSREPQHPHHRCLDCGELGEHFAHVRCQACGALAAVGIGAALVCGCGVAVAETGDPSQQPGNQTTTSVSVAAPRRGERQAVANPAAATSARGATASTSAQKSHTTAAATTAAAPQRNAATGVSGRSVRASTTPAAEAAPNVDVTFVDPTVDPVDPLSAPLAQSASINSVAQQDFYTVAPATATATGVPGSRGVSGTPAVPGAAEFIMSALTWAGREVELLTSAAAVQTVQKTAATRAVSAVTTSVTVEGEALALSPVKSGSIFSDKTASGGRALLMSTNGSASTTTTTPAFSSLVIRAKGDQYKGAPTMTVSVDGKVVSTVSVSATGWTDYTIPVTGTAGTHTITVAYTNELKASASKDRNLRVDRLTVVASTVTPPVTTAPYFQSANWLWKPIGANPTVAANSATWVSYFAAKGTQHVAELHEEGTVLIPATSVTGSTPRYDVTFTQPWGADPFGSNTVPIPLGSQVPHQGGDAHMAVMDPVTGMVYGLWQANYSTTTKKWTASWGGMTPINGNGIDTSGSATATGISRYAGVVTAAEMTAAIAANTGVNHALVFATDIAGPGFVGPAIKSDGTNIAGVATPIPEGYRIQLDPSINVDALPGLTPGEKVIAKTLQTYGAYVVDKGSARMSFAFESTPDSTDTNPGKVWTDAGFAWDYYDMAHIPWSSLRVLAP